MEQVVLVDNDNVQTGLTDKASVHTADTPLHRGFSLFLFNSNQELLVTKRADTKKTFPGVWTNTVCGHPGPGESTVIAAKRRLKDELGVEVMAVKIAESQYRYQFTDKNGIMENEICPVLVTHFDVKPKPNPNPQELSKWKWMPWEEFKADIKNNPDIWSPWCVEESELVQRFLDEQQG